MASVRAVTRNVLIKLASSLVTTAGGLVVAILLNRHFGKDAYGMLVLVYTVVGLTFSISDLGTKRTLNRYLPLVMKGTEANMQLGPLVGVSLLTQLAGAFVFSVAIAMSSAALSNQFFQKPALTSLILIGAVYFFCFAMYDFFVQLYQSFQNWEKEAVLSVSFAFLQISMLSAGVMCDFSLEWVLILNGLAAVITVILGLFLIPRDVLKQVKEGLRLRYIGQYGKVIWQFGFPLTIGGLNFYLIGWADKAILGRFRSTSEVAVYYLAWIALNGMVSLMKVLTMVFSPYVAELSVLDAHAIRKKFQLMFRWFFHLHVACAISMFFLIDPFISMTFGESYKEVVGVFRILLAVFLARGIWQTYGMFISNAFSLVKQSMVLGIFLACANITLNLVLVPPLGAMGAALSGALAYGLYWIVALAVTPKIRQMMPLTSVARGAVAIGCSLLATAMMWVINGYDPYLLALISFLVYWAALLILREVTSHDISIIKEITWTLRRFGQVAA